MATSELTGELLGLGQTLLKSGSNPAVGDRKHGNSRKIISNLYHHECSLFQLGLKRNCLSLDFCSVRLTLDHFIRQVKTKIQKQTGPASFDMYCYRIKKYIGAYCAVLGQVDALVFTGGIGENDDRVRETVCDGLSFFGLSIDPHKNAMVSTKAIDIKDKKSALSILVIPTDEELEIAMQTMMCVENSSISQ